LQDLRYKSSYVKKNYFLLGCLLQLFCINSSLAQKKATLANSLKHTTKAVKAWMLQQLPRKETKAMAFGKMTIHYVETYAKNDITHYYAKIPYCDTTINGFIIVQYKQNKFRYLRFHGDAYHYADTLIPKLSNTVWEVTSPVGKRKYRLAYNGLVTEVNNKPIRDSIYKYVTLITIGGQSAQHLISVLNVSLLFDDIKILNKQVQTSGKIVQVIIPIPFIYDQALQLEFDIF
jgi:hypothetical protein